MKFAHSTGMGPDALQAAFKRLITELNKTPVTIADLPAFDNDEAADAANHHGGYRAADGSVRWRP